MTKSAQQERQEQRYRIERDLLPHVMADPILSEDSFTPELAKRMISAVLLNLEEDYDIAPRARDGGHESAGDPI